MFGKRENPTLLRGREDRNPTPSLMEENGVKSKKNYSTKTF